MLKTFSENLKNKGFFEFDFREGIQSSYKFEKDGKVLTVLVAGDEALLSSSVQPGRIWTLKTPKLQQLLCHLVVSHFGNPIKSVLNGVEYESDTLVPIRCSPEGVIYKDCTGKEWIDSACTESNSLAIYDAFAKKNGESIALMLPWFYPMEDKPVTAAIDSNLDLSAVSDYEEFLGYPIESCAPKSGVWVGDSVISASDSSILYRINSAVKGFFSGFVPAPRESEQIDVVDSAVIRLVGNQKIQIDMRKPVTSGFVIDSIDSNLDLASVIPIAQSWGFGMNELRSGVTINSSVPGYQDFLEIASTVGGHSIECEPASHRVNASLEKNLGKINSILSAWGLDNTPGYFDSLQSVEVMFNDGRSA